MIKVEPPDEISWVNVEKNIEVNGDMVCPKCDKLMLPLWYTDELVDVYSGKIKHKLYGYCDEHGLFVKTWHTDDRDWNNNT